MENIVIKSIAKRIKQAVQKAGGNKEISKKSGIPLGTLNYYIAGNSDFKLTKLQDIANACDVNLSWLIGDNQTPEASPLKRDLIDEAIISIDRILLETNKKIKPSKKPELIWAMYELQDNK